MPYYAEMTPPHVRLAKTGYDFVHNRLPEDLNWVHQMPADQYRITVEDTGVLTAWYERLEPFLKRIPPKHIYNYDGTGFLLGQGKSQNVV